MTKQTKEELVKTWHPMRVSQWTRIEGEVGKASNGKMAAHDTS